MGRLIGLVTRGYVRALSGQLEFLCGVEWTVNKCSLDVLRAVVSRRLRAVVELADQPLMEGAVRTVLCKRGRVAWRRSPAEALRTCSLDAGLWWQGG